MEQFFKKRFPFWGSFKKQPGQGEAETVVAFLITEDTDAKENLFIAGIQANYGTTIRKLRLLPLKLDEPLKTASRQGLDVSRSSWMS